MNWAEFNDPVSYMYLGGTVVSSLSPIQEVALYCTDFSH